MIEIGDGGLLDWTQQLLTNRKERMMTMGIGFSVLHIITNNMVKGKVIFEDEEK